MDRAVSPAKRQLFFSAGPFAVKHFISKPLLLFCFADSEERRTEGNSRKGGILKHKLSLAGVWPWNEALRNEPKTELLLPCVSWVGLSNGL